MVAAETFVATRADGVRANSQAIIETLRELYGIEFRPGQVAVVPHGMEDRMSTLAGDPAGSKDGRFVDVLFTGRLEPRKGIDILLQVIPQLCSRFEQARFVLVGEDSPQAGSATRASRFRALHANAPFLDRVIFAGKVSDGELERHLSQCDIFVAPSHYESFGLVFLEAMMFGKPVIGCRAGGMPEVIDEGVTGLLAEPGDAKTLRAALSELLANRHKRESLGKAGRERFLQHYTREALAERTLAFYRPVLASRTQRTARENQVVPCTV
jgi:glycosyltransferase involved in cell wall biosynthesis